MVARDLHASLRYTWWPQHRGFLRNTLKAGTCDVVMGLPSSVELAATTRPYYRSTYVFVYRKDRGIAVRSFDDPVLRKLKIGVQMVGDDGYNSPPAHALANRGIIDNIAGYSVYGDYSQPNPPARIVEAVARGDVDLAVVWGPLAGYFAPRQPFLITRRSSWWRSRRRSTGRSSPSSSTCRWGCGAGTTSCTPSSTRSSSGGNRRSTPCWTATESRGSAGPGHTS